MKFLCLCGAYGSAEKFAVQLAPLIKELRSDGTADLHFIHGPIEAFPPEGFETFFGNGPYFRFMKGRDEKAGDDVLDRIRNFPQAISAEEQMRMLIRGGVESTPFSQNDGIMAKKSAEDALNYVYDIMERDGPFDGIIGYSEGATVAATLLLHEQKRFKLYGTPPMMKCALFFAGWPPLSPELDRMVLADESNLMIAIPTCHIIGSLDPYLAGSMALYNICDMDTAYMFDHAKGHTLPRDKDTVKELADIVRQMRSSLLSDSDSDASE